MIAVNVSVGQNAAGAPVCVVAVKRDASKAVRHAEGDHALAPTHLDAEASAATCETPVQYAFDYNDRAASSCSTPPPSSGTS